MSETIALLVGGTKVLERELQNHLTMPLVSVATIEEAAKILGERPTRLIVLGPTLRRALATVTTLRREGQTEPRLMVVYRDDQRDEVKRHQKGRQVADSYIAQSRIQREVGPALAAMLSESAESPLEEIGAEALSSAELAADDAPPPVAMPDLEPPALGGHQRAETLEADILELLDEMPMAEDDLLEELDDGDLTLEELPLEGLALDELPLADLSAALEPAQPSGEHDLLSSELLEEMGEDMELEELSLEGAEILSESAGDEGDDELDSLEIVEEVVAADLIEEVSASAEKFEELEAVELLEDLEQPQDEDTAEVAPPAAEPVAPAEVAAPAVEPAVAAAEVVASVAVVAAAVDAGAPAPAAEASPDPEKAPASGGVDKALGTGSAPALAAAVEAVSEEVAPLEVAPLPPMAHAQVPTPAEAAPARPAAVEPVAPVANISRRQPSGAQAMFSELTSFMERLQDAASANSRLESENEQLREALELAKRTGRPELEAEVSTLRQSVGDLQLRLAGAEQARDAAVEARMRAEQSQGAHAEELTRLRAELTAAIQELGALRQELGVRGQQEQVLRHEAGAARTELAAAQAQLSTLESQLDARRRISADSAKSLRAIAMMLEE